MMMMMTVKLLRANWKICFLRPLMKSVKTKESSETIHKRTTRQSLTLRNFRSSCFFCDQVDDQKNLLECQTIATSSRVKKIAVELSDTKRIAKLSKGNMIATAHFLFIGLRRFGLNLDLEFIDDIFLFINQCAKYLKEEICCALPFWFAASGCNTVSAFAGKGKKTAWQTWSCYPEATESFLR